MNPTTKYLIYTWRILSVLSIGCVLIMNAVRAYFKLTGHMSLDEMIWPGHLNDIIDPIAFGGMLSCLFYKKHLSTRLVLGGLVALAMGITSEFLQKLHLLTGTYDITDIFVFILGFSILALAAKGENLILLIHKNRYHFI